MSSSEPNEAQFSDFGQAKTNTNMSRAQNPLTGRMSGSMGNFVTTRLGDKNIIRAKAFEPRDAKSETQVKHRSGFKMLVDLYFVLRAILETGFALRAEKTSVYLAFMAANMPKALDKSGDETVIDFSRLIVAEGRMPALIVSGATLDETGISVAYYPMLRNELNLATDEIVAVALLKTGELWVEKQERGTNPTDTVLIPVLNASAENLDAVYLFAKRADGSMVSKSVFVALVP